MTLNPITVVHEVIDEYKSYLRTLFRAGDPKLREALERVLGADDAVISDRIVSR